MSKKSNQDLSQKYQQLQEIVQWFEQAEIGDVQQATEKYEQGQQLVKDLQQSLKNIEQNITQLDIGLK